MDPLHARYPFLPAAREAVEASEADLGEVIRGAGPVVGRAAERVEGAVESRTVGDPHRSDRVELLSYPVARVLVSLIDEPALTDRYADAEARTAIERLRSDADEASELRSVSGVRLSREAFIEALGLSGAVVDAGDGYDVAVATYLRLAGGLDGDRWRLVNRALAAGRVPVSAAELDDLLREAVRERVGADLPLTVPEGIADALSDPVAEIASLLSDFSVDRAIDAVEPELFPPCVKALSGRVRDGGPLPDHSRFAYVSFLATIGMDGDEIATRLSAHPDADEEAERYRIDHLTDRDAAAYLPPSCATMQAYGDCVNQDALCDRIGHPLEYYRRRLDGADPEALEAEA
jgi:DNA primase large subunit